MTSAQFENGYWYATELKIFAKSIGIAHAGRLRKDQLDHRIKRFLAGGKVESSENRPFSRTGLRDVDLGLGLDLPVTVFTNDRGTWDFIEQEARKQVPGLKRKSGARYRLNRWREEQIAGGRKITYGDLVRECIRLNQVDGPLPRIPQARYINFLSDFLKAEKGATREQAIKAWKKLKTLDAPKDYRSWKKQRRRKL